MAVTDVCILKVIGRYQSQNIVNTFHYQIVDQEATETGVLDQLCQAWVAFIQITWVARHIDTYELIGLKAFNKVGPSKTPGFLAIGTAGGVVGEEMPASQGRTITLYTADPKHRRRGRCMLSGGAISMFNTDDGAVTNTEIIALDALGVLFQDPIDANNNTFQCVIPATAVDSEKPIIDTKGRTTPSLIRSRRIRQFMIG